MQQIKAGVVGYPVIQSLSPLIHGHWIAQYGLSGSYEHIEIIPDQFDRVIGHIIDENEYDGFNITAPYKQSIMTFCDVLEDTAKDIGAVNTVIINNGHVTGRNTDAFGFIANLKMQQPALELKGSKALILGAGGAARAVIYGLRDEGVSDIYITNRTSSKAAELATDFQNDSCNCHVVPWEERASFSATHGIDIALTVNTTSLGMLGKSPLEFDVGKLPDDSYVYDIVYAPLHTQILNDAVARDLKIVTGLGMLLHQARPAFEAWFGIMPDLDDALINKITKAAQ